MRAGKGEKIMITADNINCPASAAAFGFKPLPEKLSSGQMLYNMELFATPEASQKAMDSMTRLEQNEIHGIILYPLQEDMEIKPDVMIIKSLPEHLMWIALASIYKTGERLKFDSAIFQATCVDSTIIPFVTDEINSTLGCFGCRDATDIEDKESLMGIPYNMLDEIYNNLRALSEKAIPRARGKQAYNSFSGCQE